MAPIEFFKSIYDGRRQTVAVVKDGVVLTDIKNDRSVVVPFYAWLTFYHYLQKYRQFINATGSEIYTYSGHRTHIPLTCDVPYPLGGGIYAGVVKHGNDTYALDVRCFNENENGDIYPTKEGVRLCKASALKLYDLEEVKPLEVLRDADMKHVQMALTRHHMDKIHSIAKILEEEFKFPWRPPCVACVATDNTEYCDPCKDSINIARGHQFENAYGTIPIDRINELVKGRTGGILPLDVPNPVFDPFLKIFAKRYYLEMAPYPILPHHGRRRCWTMYMHQLALHLSQPRDISPAPDRTSIDILATY